MNTIQSCKNNNNKKIKVNLKKKKYKLNRRSKSYVKA